MSNYKNDFAHCSYSATLNEAYSIHNDTISQIYQKHIDTFPYDIAVNSLNADIDYNKIEDKMIVLEKFFSSFAKSMYFTSIHIKAFDYFISLVKTWYQMSLLIFNM